MIDFAHRERRDLIAGVPRDKVSLDLAWKRQKAIELLGERWLLHPSRAREIRRGGHLPGRENG